MRIERWLTLLAMVSAGSAGASSDYVHPPAVPMNDTLDVRIVRRTELHPREELRKVCRAAWDVDGCTDFPVETLECRCEQSGDEWMIKPTVEIEAVTHLRRASQHGRLMVHEEMHMTDLTEGLRKHLQKLASRRYGTEDACRTSAWALSGSAHIKTVMNRLRVASNTKFGCSRGRGRGDAIAPRW